MNLKLSLCLLSLIFIPFNIMVEDQGISDKKLMILQVEVKVEIEDEAQEFKM